VAQGKFLIARLPFKAIFALLGLAFAAIVDFVSSHLPSIHGQV